MHLKSMNQNSGTLDHLLIMISQRGCKYVEIIEIDAVFMHCNNKAYLMNIDDFDNLFCFQRYS